MSLINFYEKLSTKDRPTYDNPNKTLCIDHPAKIVISGPSGSGKGNCLTNLMNEMKGSFDNIFIVAKTPDEPLYKYMSRTFKDRMKLLTENIDELPEQDDEIWKTGQNCVIIDDFVCDAKRINDKIAKLFTMGRKFGGEKCGASVIYITQDIYRTPVLLRRQAQYLMLKGKHPNRSLHGILQDYSLPYKKEDFVNTVNHCNESYSMCCTLDLITTDDSKKIRCGIYPSL